MRTSGSRSCPTPTPRFIWPSHTPGSTKAPYDKAYVDTHVIGFEPFRAYIMGEEDGVPKTPAWPPRRPASPNGPSKRWPANGLRTLPSTLHYYGGSYIRGPYSHEPARLEVCLVAMQGMGKPGVHVYNKMADGLTQLDMPRPEVQLQLDVIRSQVWSGRPLLNVTPQLIPKTQFHQAILDGTCTSWGNTSLYAHIEDQFKKYTIPSPKKRAGAKST